MVFDVNKCPEFISKPTRNPDTNEDFDFNTKEYLDYVNGCNLGNQPIDRLKELFKGPYCEAFFNNTNINPMFGISINKNDTDELHKLCGYNNPIEVPDKSIAIDCNILAGAEPNCLTEQPLDNIDNIDRWMDAQRRYINNLSNSDKELLSFYESGDMFEWNAILRGLKNPCTDINPNSTNNGKTPEDLAIEFQRFYNIIMKAPRTPKMYVFRGEVNDKLDTYNYPFSDEGMILKNGFISTTIDIRKAATFSSASWGPNGYVYDVPPEKRKVFLFELPLGTPALFISIKPGKNITFDSRLEIVLPPNIMRYLGINGTIETPGPITDFPQNIVFNTDIIRLKYITIVPLTYFPKGLNAPTEDLIIEEFIKYINSDDPGINPFGKILEKQYFSWVVKGGYGINKLLEHRYKRKNLNPTYDLDLAVYVNTNTISLNLIDDFILTVERKLIDFINYMNAKYIMPTSPGRNRFDIVKRNISPTYILLQLKYSICGTNYEPIIDISFIGTTKAFDNSILDTDLTTYLKLPIKNAKGYLAELKELLKRTLYKYQEPNPDPYKEDITYWTRNPLIAGLKPGGLIGGNPNPDKGKKALKRAELLCSSDRAARSDKEYKEMCRILETVSLEKELSLPDTATINDAFNKALELENLFKYSNAL